MWSLRSHVRRRDWRREGWGGIEKQKQLLSLNPDVVEKQKAKSFPEGKSSFRLRRIKQVQQTSGYLTCWCFSSWVWGVFTRPHAFSTGKPRHLAEDQSRVRPRKLRLSPKEDRLVPTSVSWDAPLESPWQVLESRGLFFSSASISPLP